MRMHGLAPGQESNHDTTDCEQLRNSNSPLHAAGTPAIQGSNSSSIHTFGAQHEVLSITWVLNITWVLT